MSNCSPTIAVVTAAIGKYHLINVFRWRLAPKCSRHVPLTEGNHLTPMSLLVIIMWSFILSPLSYFSYSENFTEGYLFF